MWFRLYLVLRIIPIFLSVLELISDCLEKLTHVQSPDTAKSQSSAFFKYKALSEPAWQISPGKEYTNWQPVLNLFIAQGFGVLVLTFFACNLKICDGYTTVAYLLGREVDHTSCTRGKEGHVNDFIWTVGGNGPFIFHSSRCILFDLRSENTTQQWTLCAVQFNLKSGGQRVATMLMYLSDRVEGGETYFPWVGATYQRVAREGILSDGENALLSVVFDACWFCLEVFQRHNMLVLQSGPGECSCGGVMRKGQCVKPKQGDALLFWNTVCLSILPVSLVRSRNCLVCANYLSNTWKSIKQT